jgi:predicted RNA binding protein YcfA (HicA-like mRNA interferase family)
VEKKQKLKLEKMMSNKKEAIKELKDNGFTVVRKGDKNEL